jgi:uncharacterized protein
MYQSGLGVPQRYEDAVAWYRLAADQGLEDGQYDLGVMYFNGQGVPQNYISAHMWFNLVAARSHNVVIQAQAIKNRDLVATKMTPAQIAEAQRMASEWKPSK